MKLGKPQLDIGLVTSDADRARAFYRDILGLVEEEPKPFGADALQYRFQVGHQLIKLMSHANPPPKQPTGIYDRVGYRVIAIMVDDLAAVRHRIHDTGRKTTAPVPILGRFEVSFAKDADGNLIELIGLPAGMSDGIEDRIQIGLTVSDPERSRDFYGRVLGLPEHERMQLDDGTDRYAFSAGSSTIKFWSPKAQPESGTGPVGDAVGIRYVTFSVYDLDGVCKEIAERGGVVTFPPTRLPSGSRIAFVSDPDGNWIEFLEVETTNASSGKEA